MHDGAGPDGGEPSLAEVLDDPIAALLRAADGLDRGCVLASVRDAQGKIAPVRDAGITIPVSRPDDLG